MKNYNTHPIRLENDHIIESIVTVHINTDYNESFLSGYLLQYLNEGRDSDLFSRKDLTDIEGNDYSIYSNSRFSFKITTENISFNCVDFYQGWNDYSPFIESGIEALSRYITGYQGLQLRYISLFENISIFEKLNGKVTLNAFPDFNNMKLSFDFIIEGNPKRLISNPKASVRARNRVPMHEGSFASIVDISLDSKFNLSDCKAVIQNLEHCHEQEKNIFFSFISQNFIDELGPSY